MGSKKKKGSRNNNSSHSNNNDAVRRTQPDVSKYAGAVSNKSKRNYADLRLVRPDNLKEYASKSAQPRSNSSIKNTQAQYTEYSKRNVPPKRAPSGSPKDVVSSRTSARASSTGQKNARRSKTSDKPVTNSQSLKLENCLSGFVNVLGSLANSISSVNLNGAKKKLSAKNSQKLVKKPNRPKPSGKSSGTKKQPAVEYRQDEYSKALNNSDFYSSVVEKYYMKHPEELNKRDKSGASRKRKKTNNAIISKGGRFPNFGQTNNKAPTTDKSVAEMAVKGRGTVNKKSRAQVVKSGKAKGIVTSRAAHRRVRQRNRRRTVIFNSVMIMTTVIFLIAVYVTVFFNVKKIEVNGESPYDSNKIVSMCGFTKGDNILFVDAKSSENQIVKNLPYIESCTIKLRLPATVVVNVTEAKALGVTELASNQWAVISNKGKILEMVTNLTIVSSSDAITSLTYDPEVSSIYDVAVKRDLPVLQGLDITGGTAGGYVEGNVAQQISDFDVIASEAKSFGMKITRISLGDRGYEMEYDGRINIVLGEITDRKVMKTRIETADYIVRTSGDITEHEHGEITYLKNETFYNPTYDTSNDNSSSGNQNLNNKDVVSAIDLVKSTVQQVVDVKNNLRI